jgi:protein TonB
MPLMPRAAGRRRTVVAVVVAAVCLLHAALFMVLVHRGSTPPVPVQPDTIVADLRSPAPVAIVSMPARPKAAPAPLPVAPRPQPHAAPLRSKPVAPTPTHDAPGEPVPVAAAPAASPPQPAAAPAQVAHAPAAAAPRMGVPFDPAIPKSVARLACAMAQPRYPALSRRADETGTVVLQLTIGADGRIASIRIVTSSGHPRLDDAAQAAAAASTCEPYLENGVARSASANVPFTFNLSD